MSTIYPDAAGNQYLGDCIWANHSLDFPGISFLKANPHSSISQGLTNLCTESGLLFTSVLPQSDFNSYAIDKVFLGFSPSGDTTTSRYVIGSGRGANWGNASGGIVSSTVAMHNNSGAVITSNNFSATNRLLRLGTAGTTGSNHNGFNLSTTSNMVWAGVATNASLGLIVYSTNISGQSKGFFFFAGLLESVNTQFDYYSQNVTTKSLIMSTIGSATNEAVCAAHYISSTQKLTLTTGRAAYTISCSDGQTPGSKWAVEMWVYDNNSTLGFPPIGKVPNMLLGIGSYTLFKPEKIQGSVFPDGGSPWYLPVGTYAGKTILMRCHSSVT